MNIKILNFNFKQDTLKSEIESQTESVVLILDINYSDLSLLENHKHHSRQLMKNLRKSTIIFSLSKERCQVEETEDLRNISNSWKCFRNL